MSAPLAIGDKVQIGPAAPQYDQRMLHREVGTLIALGPHHVTVQFSAFQWIGYRDEIRRVARGDDALVNPQTAGVEEPVCAVCGSDEPGPIHNVLGHVVTREVPG